MIPNFSFDVLDNKTLESFAEFYNYLPLYVSWRDLNSNIILANDKEAKAMGFDSYKDILREPVPYESVPVYDNPLIEQFRESDERVVASQTKSRYFNRMLMPEKQWYLSLGTKVPVFNNTGKLSAIAAFKMDMTQSNLTIMNFERMSKEIDNETVDQLAQFHYCIELEHKKLTFSKRQSECLFYILRGKSAGDIGSVLGISKRTVETHIEYIFHKMGCNSRPELIEKAVKMGLMNYIPKHMILA